MRIRFLLYDVYGPGGGVLTVTLNLAAALAERHEVELVTLLRDREVAVHRLPPGVPVRTLVDTRPGAAPTGLRGRLRRLAAARPSVLTPTQEPRYDQLDLYADLRLVRYLRSVRDGVLVGMQPGINAAIARLGHRSAVRVGQEHRPFVARPVQLRVAAVRHYPRLDTLLTLTDRDADRYRRVLGARVPVAVLPNGTPAFTGVSSTQQHKVVVAAGRLDRSKGFDRLVRAWADVAKRHPGWRLRIFGDGRERAALQRQIDGLGVTGSARLMGYTSRLGEEMAAASIFVLSSRAEGYPMVLMEAMSCGLPVVSFDCPTGPREMVTPGHDGMLVPNGDVHGLADAVAAMIELGDGRRALAEAALATARRRDQATVTARWEELLRGLLQAKRGHSPDSG